MRHCGSWIASVLVLGFACGGKGGETDTDPGSASSASSSASTGASTGGQTGGQTTGGETTAGSTDGTAGGGATGGTSGPGGTSTGVGTSGSGSSGGTGGELCPIDNTCVLSEGGPCEEPSGPLGNGCCACGPDDRCSAFCRCAAPDTPVATPDGEVAIASLRPGDLVLSVDAGRVVPVPVREVSKVPAPAEHAVLRVHLAGGRVFEMSPGHPTADGRPFQALRAGERLGDVAIAAVERVPYAHAFTHDILPDSDSGTYFAAGALVGSTLSRPARASETNEERGR